MINHANTYTVTNTNTLKPRCSQDAPPDPGSLTTRQSPPPVHILVVTGLERPPEGTLVTIAHTASEYWAGSEDSGWEWGMLCREEGCGAECPAWEQPPPLLGFSIPARAGPRGASTLCLPARIWHVSAEAFSAAPEPPPPRPPAFSYSRPPLSPWRRPTSAATAALSSRRCWAKRESLILELPPLARDAGLRGPIWGAPRVAWSSPKGLWARGASTQNPECLRRDPPRTRPPRCLPWAAQDPGSPGRVEQGGSSRLTAPGLDPGKAGLGDKAWEGRGGGPSIPLTFLTAQPHPRPLRP